MRLRMLLVLLVGWAGGRTACLGEEDSKAAAGWPHARGPQYNGTALETDLANAWPAAGPPVLWTRDIGTGYSGFAAMGSRVYTQTQTSYGQYVVCLDFDSGEELWRYRYDWPYEDAGMYPGPRATPTITTDRVFFAGPRGDVGCLRSSDGQLVWAINVIKTFDGKGFDFGYAASPLVVDGKVIVPAGGRGASVVALDEHTGELIWKSGDDEPASYGGAIPITSSGHAQFVVFLQNSLAAFDLQTGKLLWKHKFSQGYDEHAAAPIYREPHLLIASPFRAGAQMYVVESTPSPSGANSAPAFNAVWLWDNSQLSNDTASSVLVGDHLYGFDLYDLQASRRRPSRGHFRCLAWPTGEVRWSSDKTGHSTVVAADGKLFLFNDEGELILAQASPDGYTELGRGQVFGGEICWTSPALNRGRIYLRSPSRCACVFVGQPSALSDARAAAVVPLSQIPKASKIDLSWLVSGEREYPFDNHGPEELRRWFAAALFGLGVAAILGIVTKIFMRKRQPEFSSRISWSVFWVATFVLGVALTPVLNRSRPEFYFTWPLAMFAAFQLTILMIVWARQQAASIPRVRLYSRLTLLGFAAVCVSYFLLCRRLSHSMEWLFLVGFLPASVLAIPAAYAIYRRSRWWIQCAWLLAAFTCYYWTSVSVNWWWFSWRG